VAATTANSAFAVAAYLPGGVVDTSFGAGGIATVSISGGADSSGALAIQPDGKIVLAGNVTTNSPPFNDIYTTLARFVPSNTQIGWPTARPDPVSAGTNVTLTVSNISDNAYTSTTVTQVSFYQDTNGNGILDSTDLLLGTGTLNSSTGVWSFTFSTTGLHGTYTLFAQAYDSSVFYAPVSIPVTVN
jgi:hypothetical protein